MSSSKPSTNNRPFLLATAFTVVVGVGLVMAVRPAVVRLGQSRAADLVSRAAAQSGDEAALSYRVAGVLDPTNQTAAAARAELALRQGNAKRAVSLLDAARGAGESSAMRIAYLKAYLELGKISAAQAEAAALTATSTDQTALSWAAIADGVTSKAADIAALKARVSLPEALGRVTAAEASGLPLARLLASEGLYVSSRALLVKLPASYERSLMLATLDLREPTKASRLEAVDYYNAAIALDPASVTARRSLVNVLRDLGRQTDADHQQALLDRLTRGEL